MNRSEPSSRPRDRPVSAASAPIPLSACVITLDEENNIRRCLSSLQWADEVLVVDSGSEDRTRAIAEEMGARVLKHDWPGHREQKQYATDRAEHDWIFSIDADEKVDDELAAAIGKTFGDGPPDPSVSFEVNRLSSYLGAWMRHGTWHPDWIIRLFNRTRTEWGGRNPHDRVLPTEDVRRLEGLLLHWPYEGLADQMDHLNYYSTVSSREYDREGRSGGVLRGAAHAAWRLFKDYVLKRGFLDGKRGFVNTITNAHATFLKYVKLWERRNVKDDADPDEPYPPKP